MMEVGEGADSVVNYEAKSDADIQVQELPSPATVERKPRLQENFTSARLLHAQERTGPLATSPMRSSLGGSSYSDFLEQMNDSKSRRHSAGADSSHRIPGVTEHFSSKSLGGSTSKDMKRSNSLNFDDIHSCTQKNCQHPATATGYCPEHSSVQQLHSIEKLKAEFSALHLGQLKLDRSAHGEVVLKSTKPVKRKSQSHVLDTTPDFSPERLSKLFYNQEKLQLGEAIQLIDLAREVLVKEKNVLSIKAPVTVIGDVHGQFYDLLHILDLGGPPGAKTQYLFLGDYVDRGAFSCEVILYLLALKVAHPNRVFLLRGNHECQNVCAHFGFKEECATKYGLPVYYRFLVCFQTLPLAAKLEFSLGTFFCCHGGLSPDIMTVEDIDGLDRFREPDLEKDPLLDILWSDPTSDINLPEMDAVELEEFLAIEFKPNGVRSCSYFYGFAAVQTFLDTNGFLAMIRAHEVQEHGQYGHFDADIISSKIPNFFENDHPRIRMPAVLTVFSAPNYCDRYGNKGAMLSIFWDAVTFEVYESVAHPEPKVPEDSASSIHLLVTGNSCPYMPTSFRELVRMAVELGPATALPVLDSSVPRTPDSAVSDASCSMHGGISDLQLSSRTTSKRSSIADHDLGMAFQAQDFLDSEYSDVEKEELPFRILKQAPVFYSDPSNPSPPPAPGKKHLKKTPSGKKSTGLQSARKKSDLQSASFRELERKRARGKLSLPQEASVLPVGSTRSLVSRRSFSGEPLSIEHVGSSSLLNVPSANSNRSSVYKFAYARDSINEMHPEVLSRRIKNINRDFGDFPKKSEIDGPPRRMSVQDIREFYESKNRSRQDSGSTVPELWNGPVRKTSQPLKNYVDHVRARSPSCASILESPPLELKKELNMLSNNLKQNGRAVKDLVKMFGRKREDSVASTGSAKSWRTTDSRASQTSKREQGILQSQVKQIAKMYEHWVGILTGKPKIEEPDDLEPEIAKSSSEPECFVVQQLLKRRSMSEGSVKYLPHSPKPPMTPPPRSIKHMWPPQKNLSQEIEPPVFCEDSCQIIIDPDPTQISTAPKSSLPVCEGPRRQIETPPKAERESQDSLTVSEEEFYALRLIFAIFDRSGKNYITREDLHAFAEEQDDYAQHQEIDDCMSAIDCDGDGIIDLNDFILFAIRLRHLHSIQHSNLTTVKI